MCEFISWIEYKGKLLYISNYELNTPDGKELCRKLNYNFYEEIKGHGAIREYFGLSSKQGKRMECTDFSDINNFPQEIVKKIILGEFSQIAIIPELLEQSAWYKYEKVRQPARDNYEKVEKSARDNYEKVKQSAWDNYEKVIQFAWDNHEKIRQPAWDNYEKVRQPAWDNYEKVRQLARDNYKKVIQPVFWELFSNPLNRIPNWKNIKE